MQKKFVYFFILLFALLFSSCKQDSKLNFDEEDSSFFVRDFAIKAEGEETYTHVPLSKLKNGEFEFVSVDPDIEIRIVSNINLKKVDMGNDVINMDENSAKIAYGKTYNVGITPKNFTINLLANNGMIETLNFKAKYVKNHIRGLKIKLGSDIYGINDLRNATLEVANKNTDIEVLAKDVMSKVELKDEATGSTHILEFVDENKKNVKGKIDDVSEIAKKITIKIEALNRENANVEFYLKKASEVLINNITIRSTEYFDKSPFNLDKSKFTKDSNGIYVSQNIRFSDWDGVEVLFIAQAEDDNTRVEYSYSELDSLPSNFIPMPKKYIYSKWNNSAGVAPNDYLALKDVFNVKLELKHGSSYLFLLFEKNSVKTYYKIILAREKEDASLCEFIKLSPRRFPLLEFYDAEERQPNLSSNGIHNISYIFKLKNPRASIKFYANTRDGNKEIEAKRIAKGEYRGCYNIEINPLAQNSETYCEAYAVAENGRVAESKTDLNGVYSLSLNNVFLTYSYEDDKDKYKYPSIPNYIKFDRSKIVENKLFVRVIVPKILKNDIDVSTIKPTPVVAELPSNMSKYSAYYTAYKLVIDVGNFSQGTKLDITMPIKNTDTDKTLFTHLITVEEE